MLAIMRQTMKILCLSLMVFALGACAAQIPRGVLHGPSRVLEPKDYDMVLNTWTRSAKIYQGLDSKMFVTATFHSPEFRRVFALAFPEIYGHGGNITRRELVDLTHDIEQYLTFFVSAYTADRKWNDLAKPDSIWRLVKRFILSSISSRCSSASSGEENTIAPASPTSTFHVERSRL